MKKTSFVVFTAAMFISVAAFAAGGVVKMPSGLQIEDVVIGKGAEARAGKTVVVDYTGWLYENGKKGRQFDSSVGKKEFSFPLGAGMVIKGWDEGVAGMKTGGKRTLIIPSNLGYGARGAGSAIPPNSDLIFEVELFEVK